MQPRHEITFCGEVQTVTILFFPVMLGVTAPRTWVACQCWKAFLFCFSSLSDEFLHGAHLCFRFCAVCEKRGYIPILFGFFWNCLFICDYLGLHGYHTPVFLPCFTQQFANIEGSICLVLNRFPNNKHSIEFYIWSAF